MSASHTVLKLLRKLHLYIGVFITPALLFFAFTGVLQTFSLHETTQGSAYKPPSWAVKMGQLHKKQTLEVPVRKPRPVTDAPKPDKPSAAPTQSPGTLAPKPKTHLPMKIFFLPGRGRPFHIHHHRALHGLSLQSKQADRHWPSAGWNHCPAITAWLLKRIGCSNAQPVLSISCVAFSGVRHHRGNCLRRIRVRRR